MKTIFDNDNFTGVIPPFDGFPGSELLQGIVNFEPVGWSLPWKWIETLFVVVLVVCIVLFLFYKIRNEKGRWAGVDSYFGPSSLFALMGIFFLFSKEFAPSDYPSVIRSLQVDYNTKTMQLQNQNFQKYEIPFSKISHLAYIRKGTPESTGLWIVIDRKYSHAVLQWSEAPSQEEDLIKWAEELAKSWGTIFVPYHDRNRFFQSKKFRDHIQSLGIAETKISEGRRLDYVTRWTIPTEERELDNWDWNDLIGKIFVFLFFSPFYLVFIVFLSLLPTLIRYWITKKEPKQHLFKIILKSRIFYAGIFLMIAYFVSIFNSVQYIRSAEKVTIELSESRLFYSLENAKEETFQGESLIDLAFWSDVFLGIPFTVWDRLVNFSKSNEIRQELYFFQVNRVRSYGQRIIFSKREKGKDKDNQKKFTFDFSGLDPLVYQYIHRRILEVSGIR